MRCLAPVLLLCVAGADARAAERACTGFRWDVSRELAVMREPAQALGVTTNVQEAGYPLAIGEHYLVTLAPEQRVAFIVRPSHATREPESHAGILYLDVRESGRYRFALDTRHRLDLVVPGPMVLSPEGSRTLQPVGHDHGDCDLVHEVLAFDLEAGTTYEVHLSGAKDARVNLAVTLEPDR